ncbi:MAG: hypothetical protein V3T84_03555 [Phycisphaerales bacterium]
MNDHERSQLTPTGEARREQMLDELLGTMQQIHHQRRARRHLAGVAAMLLVFAGVAWVVASQLSFVDRAKPSIVENQPSEEVPNLPAPEPLFRSFERTGLVRVVSDDELVRLLAQIDRPAGIVHSEGETWLTNVVTDKELGLTHEPPPDPSTG